MLGKTSQDVNGGLVSCSEQGDPICIPASGVGSGRSPVREGTDVRQVLANSVESGVALNYTTSDPSHQVGDLDRLGGQRVRVVHAGMQRQPPRRHEARHTAARVGIEVMARPIRDDKARFVAVGTLHREVFHETLLTDSSEASPPFQGSHPTKPTIPPQGQLLGHGSPRRPLFTLCCGSSGPGKTESSLGRILANADARHSVVFIDAHGTGVERLKQFFGYYHHRVYELSLELVQPQQTAWNPYGDQVFGGKGESGHTGALASRAGRKPCELLGGDTRALGPLQQSW